MSHPSVALVVRERDVRDPSGGGDHHDEVASVRELLERLFAPLRESAVHTGRMLKHLGRRLDAFALDLARDAGTVTRDAQALAGAIRERTIAIAEQARTTSRSMSRATPRAAKLATAGAAILARHRWLRLQAAARGADGISDDDHRDLARRVTAVAAELRGGIAKLGQVASCRPDLIGPIWASELATLQDDVPPVDGAAIRACVEAELGRPIVEMFAEWIDEPIAAASLAQVHAARLLDGTEVAVKVQVPGIEDILEGDIAALRAIASLLEIPGVDLPTITDELARALASELDYAEEARALERFAATVRGPDIVVPAPIASASSSRVLTMTRIVGERLTTYLERASDSADRDRILANLVDELASQILVRGTVHADPHPGNFLVTPDGRLAILDFGCTLSLDRAERAAYARLVLAIATGNHGAAARELAQLGFVADDPAQLVELTASLIGAMRPGTAVSDIDWQSAFAEQIARAKQLGGLVIPRSFVLLGRVLATVAGLLATYKPRIHIHPLIAKHLATAIA